MRLMLIFLITALYPTAPCITQRYILSTDPTRLGIQQRNQLVVDVCASVSLSRVGEARGTRATRAMPAMPVMRAMHAAKRLHVEP